MARSRLNGVISGHAGVEAHIIDTIGGGICTIHGKHYGYGKHGLKACPRCDIDAYYKPIILYQHNFENCGGYTP